LPQWRLDRSVAIYPLIEHHGRRLIGCGGEPPRQRFWENDKHQNKD